MRARGVIFDMDGVLWQSGPIHDQAFRDVLGTQGIAEFDYSTVAGQRTADVIRAILRREGRDDSDGQVAALASRKSAVALERLRVENPITPHAMDVVQRLAAGMPVALATSASVASADLFLDRNAARPFFSAVVNGRDVVNAKPAPDLFLAAARRLQLPPDDCLVVEDSIAGVAGARTAGCSVVGFAPGGETAPLRKAGASEVVSSLDQLIALVGLNTSRLWDHADRSPQRPPAREDWTAVIAAAGRGTRLGFTLPKVLYPVAGRPILDWLFELFAPRSAAIVVVVSPEGRAAVERHCTTAGNLCRTVVQDEPTGMASAVMCGLSAVDTRNVIIAWGDQPAIRPETIELGQWLHASHRPLATVPTLLRDRPYIHFVRGADGGLVRILQRREEDDMPARGESDSGLFLFNTAALRRELRLALQDESLRGSVTREQNLLPILPRLDRLPGNVLSARIVNDIESIGVNTRDDAETLSSALLSRRPPPPPLA